MSNFIGQLLVEKFGHVFSLTCSMWLSIIPIVLFGFCMPETLNTRGAGQANKNDKEIDTAAAYGVMA